MTSLKIKVLIMHRKEIMKKHVIMGIATTLVGISIFLYIKNKELVDTYVKDAKTKLIGV